MSAATATATPAPPPSAPSGAAGADNCPAIKTSPRGPMVLVVLVVLVAFGAFGAWAVMAPLAGGAVAMGKVEVLSNRKTVQHLEGGIVGKLLVSDGDRVEAGQVLLRLDDTRARVSHNMLKVRHDEIRAREARLSAERDGLDRIGFPPDLLQRQDELQIASILAVQTEQFAARRQALENEAEILVQRIDQLDQQIEGLQAQATSKEGQMALIEDELEGLRDLYEKGLTPRTRVLELERAALRLRGEWGQHLAEMSRAQVAQGEARLQIIQLERRFQESVIEELRQVQSEMYDVADRLESAADVLERQDVRAPMAGTVVAMRIHTEGGVIKPGEPLMDIVPDNEQLVVRAMVLPDDIDHVYPGLEAEVRLTAFQRRTTPTVFGTVERVSADALTDAESKMDYYEARIAISDDELSRLGDLELLPGMRAEVMVKTTERTLLDYLVAPITESVRRAFFFE